MVKVGFLEKDVKELSRHKEQAMYVQEWLE